MTPIEALAWISRIAWANYEQDINLRAKSARTLKRIAERADKTLEQVTGVKS